MYARKCSCQMLSGQGQNSECSQCSGAPLTITPEMREALVSAITKRIERHAATVSKWSRLHDEAVEEAAEKAYAIAAVQGEAWTRTTTDAQQPGYLDVEVVASPSRPPSTPAAMLGEAVEEAATKAPDIVAEQGSDFYKRGPGPCKRCGLHCLTDDDCTPTPAVQGKVLGEALLLLDRLELVLRRTAAGDLRAGTWGSIQDVREDVSRLLKGRTSTTPRAREPKP